MGLLLLLGVAGVSDVRHLARQELGGGETRGGEAIGAAEVGGGVGWSPSAGRRREGKSGAAGTTSNGQDSGTKKEKKKR